MSRIVRRSMEKSAAPFDLDPALYQIRLLLADCLLRLGVGGGACLHPGGGKLRPYPKDEKRRL
jgi:hypothetical protein